MVGIPGLNVGIPGVHECINKIIQQAELNYSLLLDDLTGSSFIVEEAPTA